jgi:16S rRNA (cytidine1402-2'-O)-methyltransferase
MSGTFYIVATPIGNMEDISERALATLASVSAILCEDTRVSGKLLSRYEIKKELISFHQHSTLAKVKEIIARLEAGEDLALITDAGTPSISDPGGKLVEEVVRALPECTIVPIPGASAIITALSVSGFPADKFVFLGFPPHKKGRNTYFEGLATQEHTVVIYESTHRIYKTLEALEEVLGERPIMVARELTKMHETCYRGTAASVTEQLKSTSIKGEFVIVIRAL